MRANLSGVDAGAKTYDPVPRGKYHVRLTEGEWREVGPSAKNAGANMLNAEFTIQKGEYEGRHIWTNFIFVDNSIWKFKQFLAASGKYSEDELEASDFEFEIDDIVNLEAVAKVKYKAETEQYDASNDIQQFFPVGEDTSEGKGSLLP